MDKFKNLEQKIILNNENNDNQQNKIIQKEKEEDNEIIIEIEINKENEEKEIYILCDKNKLFEDNKYNEDYYRENN